MGLHADGSKRGSTIDLKISLPGAANNLRSETSTPTKATSVYPKRNSVKGPSKGSSTHTSANKNAGKRHSAQTTKPA